MVTYIIKAVLTEAGRPLRVQLYYVTVATDADDPLSVFDGQDNTPDTVSAYVIHTLSEAEAEGFGFASGEVRDVANA
jgi:hypothetical protein